MLIPLLSAAICWIGQQLAARFTNVWHDFFSGLSHLYFNSMCIVPVPSSVCRVHTCIHVRVCVCLYVRVVCMYTCVVCLVCICVCVHAVPDVGDCSVGVCVKCMLV